MRKEAAGAPTLVAELFGPVTTDPFDVDYYIGSPETAAAELEQGGGGNRWVRTGAASAAVTVRMASLRNRLV